MTIANALSRFPLKDQSGSRWVYTVSAHVVDGELTILEVTESTWRQPAEVVRFVGVAEFLEKAERNGISADEVRERLVAMAPKAKRTRVA